jgi:DNA polymerase III delta prime subunit
MATKKLYDVSETLIDKYNSLWVEKYRPKILDELVVNDNLYSFIKKCIEENDIPHLLLHGRPGTGKNSIVNVLNNNLKAITLTINASEERGIDTIRDKVQGFARSSAWANSLKIVILNEADGLNYTAQDSLRELMETTSKSCRFILTCNYINRISDAIRSRCSEFELMPKNIDIAGRLTNILDAENITYSNGYIIELIKKYGTDIRKMINESQKLSASHEVLSEDVLLDQFSSKYNEFFDKMFSFKDAKKISDLAKKMLFDEDIYTALKDYVIAKYNNMDAVIIIADHAYKSRIVMDKDLVFLSCIFNLMEVMK